ncbi:acyl-CoA thioesterase [Secundilactobacillus kimchicus]|uniref:Acyl-CoA thioester hydrolase n=1 Tax=Secundilactobacillus kimchicus JCM 15530 TaxID=1302272 RepID=A0A0R1HY62_9LACO|nr:hotdog domain-containing protein [Secundilactobacillus kimchicus]KRK48545.1 acyl-CoA thioester hydrolase [Secundilactobacillus kimchicus JCM 15530]MBT9671292.1 acyl-CoA thioesterase [Secundilactobacillus kimchicus]
MTTHQLTCQQTRSLTNHRVFNSDLNEHGTVFGGQILSMVDDSSSIAAAVAARQVTVTVTMDHINFIAPYRLQDAMIFESFVTGTSHRSLEVFVKGLGEHLMTGERFLGFSCFVTFVTDSKPADPELPLIVPETDEERFLCAGYANRLAQRRTHRDDERTLREHLDLSSH